MTTPNNALYENQPQHWNQPHAFTINATGSEISNAFSNANGVSFGISGGAITASHNAITTGMASNRGSDFVQATAAFAGTSASGTIASNGISVSIGPYITTAMLSNAATISNIRVSAGTTSNLLSALTFADGNGISFGLNASTLTASYTRPVVSNAIQSIGSATGSGTNTSRFAADDHVHAGVFSLGVSTAGNTIGDTRVDVGRFVLQGGNNVTLSQITAANALNTIVISGGAAGGADGVNALVVNGGASTASTTLALSNANNVSFGHNAGTITASASFAQTNQSAIRGFGVSNTGQTAGNTGISTGIDWVVAGSQSITLSQSTAGGGPNTVWIQHPAWITTAMLSNAATISNIRISAGTTSNLLSALTFNDANGLSFGLNASTITGSYSRPVVSNAIASVGSATNSGTNTSRFAADDHIHAGVFSMGVSTGGNTSGDTRVDVGRFVLQGGNNITLSQVTAANALNTIVVSAGAGGGVNPVASASNGSFSFTTLGFSNANNVTFGTSAGSIITASVAAPGAAAENNWVNLLGANTAGNTTASGSTIGYSGINLTLSGTNGSVVNVSAPATSSLVGTNGVSISSNGSTISVMGAMGSYFQNIPFHWSAIQSTSFVQSTSMVQPLEIPDVLSIGRMRFLRSVLAGATSVATVANTSWGFTQNHTHNFVFYTRGTGASSLSLTYYTSTSIGLSMTIQGSNGAASNNLSVFRSISAPVSNGLSQFTFSTAPAGSASLPFATTDCSNFISGLRLHDSSFGASFNPGLYYLVHGISTTGTTGGATAASALTACTLNFGALMIIGLNSNIASFGTSAQSFNHALCGIAGSFTTAGGGTTDNIGSVSNFTSIASNPVIYFVMDRIA